MNHVAGRLYKRPVEQVLGRLGNYWQLSQPAHLRHLGLVKDTQQVDRTSVFVHYTRNQFQAQVDRGETSWDAVEVLQGVQVAIPQLDKYGFPVLDHALFEGSENEATLAGALLNPMQRRERKGPVKYNPEKEKTLLASALRRQSLSIPQKHLKRDCSRMLEVQDNGKPPQVPKAQKATRLHEQLPSHKSVEVMVEDDTLKQQANAMTQIERQARRKVGRTSKADTVAPQVTPKPKAVSKPRLTPDDVLGAIGYFPSTLAHLVINRRLTYTGPHHGRPKRAEALLQCHKQLLGLSGYAFYRNRNADKPSTGRDAGILVVASHSIPAKRNRPSNAKSHKSPSKIDKNLDRSSDAHLPSTAAHTQPVLYRIQSGAERPRLTSRPRKKTAKALESTADSLKPSLKRKIVEIDTIESPKRRNLGQSFSYKEQAALIPRSGVGVYVGDAVGLKRVRPRGRPPTSRLVIIKTSRLPELRIPAETERTVQDNSSGTTVNGIVHTQVTESPVQRPKGSFGISRMPKDAPLSLIDQLSQSAWSGHNETQASYEKNIVACASEPPSHVSENDAGSESVQELEPESGFIGDTAPIDAESMSDNESDFGAVLSAVVTNSRPPPMTKERNNVVAFPRQAVVLVPRVDVSRFESEVEMAPSMPAVEVPTLASGSEGSESLAEGSEEPARAELDTWQDTNEARQKQDRQFPNDSNVVAGEIADEQQVANTAMQQLEVIAGDSILGEYQSPSKGLVVDPQSFPPEQTVRSTGHPPMDPEEPQDEGPSERQQSLSIPNAEVLELRDTATSSALQEPRGCSTRAEPLHSPQASLSREQAVEDQHVQRKSHDSEAAPVSEWTDSIARENANMVTETHIEQPKKPERAFGKMSAGGGSVAVQRRNITLSIVKQAGGICPGDRELWYPFATQWMKTHQGVKPDRRTMKTIKDSMVMNGQLRQYTFSHLGKAGSAVIRNIVTLPEVEASDPRIKELQEKMIACDPSLYLPEGFEISSELKAASSDLASEAIASRPQRSQATLQDFVASGNNDLNGRATTKAIAKKRKQKTHDDAQVTRKKRRASKGRRGSSTLDKFNSNGINAASSDEFEAALRLSNVSVDMPPPNPIVSTIPGKASEASNAIRQELRIQNSKWSFSDAVQAIGNTAICPIRSTNCTDDFVQMEPDSLSAGEDGPALAIYNLNFEQESRIPVKHWIDFEHPDLGPEDSDHALDSQFTVSEQIPIINHHFSFDSCRGILAPHSSTKGHPSLRKQFPSSVHNADDQRRSTTYRDLTNHHQPHHELMTSTPYQDPNHYEALEDSDVGLNNLEPTRCHLEIQPLVSEPQDSPSFLRVSRTAPSQTGPATSPARKGVRKRRDMVTDGSLPTTKPEPKRRKPSAPKAKLRRLTALSAQVKAKQDEPEHTSASKGPKRIRLRGPQRTKLDVEKSQRVFLAVLISKTVFGGVNSDINWKIVDEMLEADLDRLAIRRTWNRVRVEYKDDMQEMQEEFQEIFIQGYESGAIPLLNFEDTGTFDWKWLLQWTNDKLKASTLTTMVLPSSRYELDRKWELRSATKRSQIDYFETKSKSTIEHRYALLNKYPLGVPLKENYQSSEKHDSVTLASNWIKANVSVPESSYSSQAARAKLLPLGEENIQKAVKELLSARVLAQENKGRLMPGRTYDISTAFLHRFKSNLELISFRQAASYKENLDSKFDGEESVYLDDAVKEGEVIAMINMISHGRIRPVQHDVPMNKWGLCPLGSYETRKIDKTQFRFKVELTPTDAYVQGNPLLPYPEAPRCKLLEDDKGQDITKFPLWYDINGDVVEVLWALVRASVMAILAVEPGYTIKGLQDSFKNALEPFELQLVLQWIVDAGAGEWVGTVAPSVRLTEWWWLGLGIDIDQANDIDLNMGEEATSRGKGKGKEKANESDVDDVHEEVNEDTVDMEAKEQSEWAL